jgi:hypothetical protein
VKFGGKDKALSSTETACEKGKPPKVTDRKKKKKMNSPIPFRGFIYEKSLKLFGNFASRLQEGTKSKNSKAERLTINRKFLRRSIGIYPNWLFNFLQKRGDSPYPSYTKKVPPSPPRTTGDVLSYKVENSKSINHLGAKVYIELYLIQAPLLKPS